MKRIIVLIGLLLLMVLISFGQSNLVIVKDTASILRQHNVTAYTAGDVIANDTSGAVSTKMFVFNKAFRSEGGSGLLRAVLIQTDTVSVTNGTLRLFIYSDSTNAGIIYDNGANAVSIQQMDSCEGFVDFTLEITGSGSGTTGFDYVILTDPMPVYAEDGSQKLFGRLTATAAWVPKHNGHIKITLFIDQNE
jgi:hypothetical protein